MPQFDTANFASQLFWFGVFFAVLYFAVIRPTLPKIGKVMDARETQVAGDLDRAEQAKGAADGIRAAHEAAMKDAQGAAQAKVNAAREAAARAAEARLKELNARLDAEAEAAANRLDAARAAARDSLAGTVAELTAEAVAKLAGISVTPAEVQQAIKAGALKA